MERFICLCQGEAVTFEDLYGVREGVLWAKVCVCELGLTGRFGCSFLLLLRALFLLFRLSNNRIRILVRVLLLLLLIKLGLVGRVRGTTSVMLIVSFEVMTRWCCRGELITARCGDGGCLEALESFFEVKICSNCF